MKVYGDENYPFFLFCLVNIQIVRTLLTYTHLANRINSDNAPPSEKIREYLFIIYLYI